MSGSYGQSPPPPPVPHPRTARACAGVWGEIVGIRRSHPKRGNKSTLDRPDGRPTVSWMDGDLDAPVRRVADALGAEDAAKILADRVSGADFTSFLLDVMHRRADRVTPADVMRQSGRDRFVDVGTVDARALHATIATVIAAIPTAFEFVELAPVLPLGTHTALAPVHQHKVVSSVRSLEVAADPTVALAIVAAQHRAAAPTPTLHLGAVQRILRAQPFGAQGQQHFTVLALVSAGRDTGHLAFETVAIGDQLRALVTAVGAVTQAPVEIRLTDLRNDGRTAILDAARQACGPNVAVVDDPDRVAGRGYYRDLCFKVIVRPGPDEVEIGDGGFTDWTAQLLGNRKERLLTSGLGLDRLVTVGARGAAE